MAIKFLNSVAVDTDVLFVDTVNERVGIGTTSPASILQVGDYMDSNTLTIGGWYGGGGGTLAFKSGYVNNAAYVWDTARIRATDDGNFNGRIEFQTTASGGNAGASPTTKMVLKANGNVGIGTTSPARELDVTGAGNVYIRVTAPTSTDSSAIELANTAETWTIRNQDTNDNALEFSSDGGTKVTMARTGNVGIGTTSPSQKLHVDGNARVTGAYYDSGNTPGTVNQLLASTATGTAWIDPSTIVAEAATLVVIACKNTSGATIAQGTPVYQTGTVGATATIEIAPADALISANKLPAIGLLQTALNNNGFGNVVITGELTNFTTSPIDGVVPTTGDKVFVKSGGGLTLTKPTGEGNGIQNMGLVGKVSGGNSGSITVSSIMRTNDVPNLPEGRIWVGDGNTIVSDTVYIDEPNNRLGIGTTSPQSKLHIETGSGGTYNPNVNHDDVTIEGSGNIGLQLFSPATSYQYIAFGDPDSVNAGYLRYYHGSNEMVFRTNGGDRMVINSSGNVGIGTTSPVAKLSVVGSDNTNQANIGHSTQAVYIKVNGTNVDYNSSGNSSGSHTFSTGNLEKMRIAVSGNVGIGTTTPGYKLTVAGDAGFSDWIYASKFYPTSSTTDILMQTGAGRAITLDPTSTGKVLIPNGNVGIGTTSPNVAFKLDVIGNTSTSGNLYIGNADDLVTPTTILALNSGRVRGVTLANLINASGGPYLPLAGGTMTGTSGVLFPDNFILNIGTGSDLKIKHNGADSHIENYTGNLNVVNYADNKDVIFWSDNGAGGITTYFELDGAAGYNKAHKDILYLDNIKARFGNSNDLQIYHDGSDSYINDTGTGHLVLNTNGASMKFLFGSEFMAQFEANGSVDLYHNNSKKFETTSTGVTVTGEVEADTHFTSSDTNVTLSTLSNGTVFLRPNGQSSTTAQSTFTTALATIGTDATFAGTVTAPTFLGDLNGTINTVTTAVTKANATNDTTVATTAFVQNLIGTIPAGLVFQGTWDAATNTPTLTSGSGTTGHFYIVSTSGSTNLDGVTDWVTGDWAVFIEQGATDAWEKIDNSSVLDGIGTGNRVAKWSGSGTSNTLTNSGIQDASNAVAITINGNEEVGIGTVAPFSILHTKTSAENVGRFESTDATAYIQINDNADSFYIGTGTQYGSIGGNAGLNANNLNIGLTTGNVGIGTTSPGAKLDVQSVTGTLRLGNNIGSVATGAVVGKIEFSNVDTSIGAGVQAYIQSRAIDNGATYAMDFFTGTKNNPTQTSLSLYNGKVGIGTTSPSQKLHINNSTASSVSYAKFSNAQTGTTTADGFDVGVNTGVEAVIWQRENSNLLLATNNSERMRIDSAGNVGIGTTSPGAKLDVRVNGIGNSAGDESDSVLFQGDRHDWIFKQIRTAATADWNSTTLRLQTRVDTSNMSSIDFVTDASYNRHIDINTASNSFSTRFAHNGNVGIGTTSPGAKLNVAGDILINSGEYISWGTVGATSIEGSTASNKLQFRTNSSDRMIIDSAGNVGIGTTSPNYKLSVDDNTVTTIPKTLLQFDAASIADNGGYNIDFRTSSNNTADRYVSRIRGIRESTGALSQLSFWTESGSALEQRMTIRALGNVGIGTTSPNSKLHVYDATADTSINVNTGTGGSYPKKTGISFGATSTSLGGDAKFTGGAGIQAINTAASGNPTDLTFWTNSTGTPAERMRITSAGDTGIGVTTPRAKLDVAGGIKVADDTDTAGANKVGTLRYRTSGNNSYVDMCMQTGASTYEWINVVQNNW